MAGGGPAPESGKKGKKALDATLNLVPFIDLLSCCISFLLITAVWTQIAGSESDHVARSWFIGANPQLGEDTPLTALRQDRGAQVVAAAAAFVEDQPAT